MGILQRRELTENLKNRINIKEAGYEMETVFIGDRIVFGME